MEQTCPNSPLPVYESLPLVGFEGDNRSLLPQDPVNEGQKPMTQPSTRVSVWGDGKVLERMLESTVLLQLL